MKTKIAQILYDMRHQPVIAWVTILGTALSIFLILIVIMMQNVMLVNVAPETHRDRMLYGMCIHIQAIDGSSNSSGYMSYSTAKKLYDNLDGVERTSYFNDARDNPTIKGSNGTIFIAQSRDVDAEFWNIFEHTLIAGRYFTKEEVDADAHIAVVSESTARKLFDGQDAIGQVSDYNHCKYKIVGVIKDVSSLATMACGEVFVPKSPKSAESWGDNYFGDISVALLVKEGVSFDHIKEQVKKRYAILDTELKSSGKETVYHGSPYNQKEIASGIKGSNYTPDTSRDDAITYAILIILLIVPAINLSSMLHSRMRYRISEIGVRRAYGCTRSRIIMDIINENMIITIVGGIIGLVAAIIFGLTYDGLFEQADSASSPALGMIINFQNILAAFIACLVLNIISAAIPAWQASRINPIEAINSNHK
jgi:putative ABC transport system permease protein